jgi:hypothetical protein
MVGAGVALAGSALADASLGEGAGSCFIEAVVGAAAWVSLVLAQLVSARMMSKIKKLINHEGHEDSRKKSVRAILVVFFVFGG